MAKAKAVGSAHSRRPIVSKQFDERQRSNPHAGTFVLGIVVWRAGDSGCMDSSRINVIANLTVEKRTIT